MDGWSVRLTAGQIATGFSGLALLAVPGLAAATEITPAGDWSVERQDESCTAQRSFTAQSVGDTTIYIRSWSADTPNQFSIVGPTMLKDDRAARSVGVGFDGGELLDVVAIASSSNGHPMTYIMVDQREDAPVISGVSILWSWNAPSGHLGIVTLPPDMQQMAIDLPDNCPN